LTPSVRNKNSISHRTLRREWKGQAADSSALEGCAKCAIGCFARLLVAGIHVLQRPGPLPFLFCQLLRLGPN
jgi:hypothetical protein